MNVNDTVIYTENEKDYVATVLEVRELEHHSGKSGEPLLHLGFFAPVFAPDASGKQARISIVGTHRQYDLAQIRLDVAHDSHEFPEELKVPKYPGGRWKEASVIVNPEVFEDVEETELEPVEDKVVSKKKEMVQ